MSLHFKAALYLTTHVATFVNHDDTISHDRVDEIPIGTPVAIDANGHVYLPSDAMSPGIREGFAEIPETFAVGTGRRRMLYRDYWCSANINVNKPHKAGPYFHAVLNALNWGK